MTKTQSKSKSSRERDKEKLVQAVKQLVPKPQEATYDVLGYLCPSIRDKQENKKADKLTKKRGYRKPAMPQTGQPEPEYILPLAPESGLSLPIPFVGVGLTTFQFGLPHIIRQCSPGAAVIYMMLYCNSYGTKERKNFCRISISSLAAQVGMGTTAVVEAIKKLQQYGFITCYERSHRAVGNMYLVGRYAAMPENGYAGKRSTLDRKPVNPLI